MNGPDWYAYRRCPTCLAETGTPCKSLSSRVVAGQPDRHECVLPEPHSRRPLRTAARHLGHDPEKRVTWCMGCRIETEIRRRAAVAHA